MIIPTLQLILMGGIAGSPQVKLKDPVDLSRMRDIMRDAPTLIRDWRGFEELDTQGVPKGWRFYSTNGTPSHVNPSLYPLSKVVNGELPEDPITIGGDYWVTSWFKHLNATGFRSGGDGQYFYSTGWKNQISFVVQQPPANEIKAWAFTELPFALNNDVLTVLVGGTREETNCQIEVWVEGATSTLPVGLHGANLPGYGLVHRFLGNNSEQLSSQIWNIPAALRNKNAKIWINDYSTSGHLNFDGFALTKAATPLVFTPIDLGFTLGTGLKLNKPIFGWADLHSHPVMQMSSGGHFVYGSIGGKYEAGVAAEERAYARDLPACDGGGHGANGPENWLAQLTSGGTIRAKVYEHMNLGKTKHDKEGYPSFYSWPHRNDPNHQQMHVNQIRRAYEGGQRLMVAAVLENQIASYMLETGFRGDSIQRYINFEVEVRKCLEQVKGIKDFAAKNADWMGIATTPAEARALADANKMIIVLAVETDLLNSVDQMRQLYDAGVRVFTVIHLTDNIFGGAAAYNPLFASANAIYFDRYYGVKEGDNSTYGVKFRFGRESLGVLQETLSIPKGISPTEGSKAVWDREYAPYTAHVNNLGLTAQGRAAITFLAQRGAIIDLAHMSHDATEQTLDMLEAYAPGSRYPSVYTHGGVRPLLQPGSNERLLHPTHASRMYAAGGVFGIGTAGGTATMLENLRILRRYDKNRGIAIGSDFNGGDINADPRKYSGNKDRVGYQGPPKRIEQGVPFRQTPAEQSNLRPGQRSLMPSGAGRQWYDINKDGLAHYGLIPDYFQDMYNIGTAPGEMETIFRGAESFVQTWEKCYSLKR